MDRFKADGYLILPDVFNCNEVEEMKEAGLQLTRTIPDKQKRAVFSTTNSPQSRNKYFLESGNKVSYFFETNALDSEGELLVDSSIALNKVGHYLHVDHPVFQKFTYNEKIREICWMLGMEDPAILQSMYIYKNPGIGSEVIPHQDETFLHTTPETRLLGFWIALDDATIENGCLWFVPASHRSGVHRRFIRNPDKDSDELLVFTSPVPTYPQSSFIPVPVKKGSCVLIDGLVVHKSEPNKSNKSRHAYTFHVADLKNTEYSKENWLQPPEGQTFPRLYSPPPTN